jgi:hypothetical protein
MSDTEEKTKKTYKSGKDSKPANPSKANIPKNNHLIKCTIYSNVALYQGDTYIYRGVFKRNNGDFSSKYKGFLVPLNKIESIRFEIQKQVQGYLVYNKNEVLPCELINTESSCLLNDDYVNINI